jgi:hypothetical protein
MCTVLRCPRLGFGFRDRAAGRRWISREQVAHSGPLRDTGRLAEGPPGADADAGTFAPLLGWSLERKL